MPLSSFLAVMWGEYNRFETGKIELNVLPHFGLMIADTYASYDAIKVYV